MTQTEAIKKTLTATAILCVTFLVFNMFSLATWLTIGILGVSVFLLIRMNLAQIKVEGLKNRLSPGLASLLFEKSIYDIYADLVYYPKLVAIAKKYLGPIISKPHPNKLKDTFEDLSIETQKIISAKGIINLLPATALNMVCEQPLERGVKQPEEPIWEWHQLKRYEQEAIKPHEMTIGGQIIERIDGKVGWASLLVLSLFVGYGISSMKYRRFRKMMLQNSAFAGVLIVAIFTLVKTMKKFKEMNKKTNPFMIEQAPRLNK